jgi:hypothetical protein
MKVNEPKIETQGVDEYLWRGSRKRAKPVMIIGGYIFAFGFIGIGAAVAWNFALFQHSAIFTVYGCLFVLAGIRIFWATRRSHFKKKSRRI